MNLLPIDALLSVKTSKLSAKPPNGRCFFPGGESVLPRCLS